MLKTLITTSGVGSRLGGNLTNYSNKSMVRIGDKPALSHILELYPIDSEFIITVGHFADHIKQFINLVYPNLNATFVDVNPYKGQGSSLAYSILQAKDYLNCPFIFHACDTIVDSVPNLEGNWLGAFKSKNNDHYVSFDALNHKVLKIHNKGYFGADYSYIGLASIKDYKEFFSCLEEIYIKDNKNSQLSDVSAITQMLQNGIDFKYHELKWYDIGNVDSLLESRKYFKQSLSVLDKDNENIYYIDDEIIKFFYDKDTCLNRVKRAKVLKDLVPEITGYSDNFYKYKFTEGKVLADCITPSIFKEFINWLKDNLWTEKKADDIKELCNNFYFIKTKKRLEEFLSLSGIKDEVCTINGIEIVSVSELLEQIDKDWLCNTEPTNFHGDLIPDNTIYNDGQFTLVDWRQDFAGEIEYGDKYYDLAKLNHNLIFNHDIIHKKLYKITSNSNNITFDLLRSNTLTECQEIYHQFIIDNNLDLNKIKILTAIIWINMAPLHSGDGLNILLYYLGRYYLNKAINESKDISGPHVGQCDKLNN